MPMYKWPKTFFPCAVPLVGFTVAIMLWRPFAIAGQTNGDETQVVIAQSRSSIHLLETAVWVPLTEGEVDTSLTSNVLGHWVAMRRLSLILKDISADAQPTSAFAVYLGL